MSLFPIQRLFYTVVLYIYATVECTSIAQKPSAKSLHTGAQKILIIEEVIEFRKHFSSFQLIAIHASPTTRFQRIVQRGRGDDAIDPQTFTARDERELKVGLGSVIAMADHVIVNEGPMTQFKNQVRTLLEASLCDLHTSPC